MLNCKNRGNGFSKSGSSEVSLRRYAEGPSDDAMSPLSFFSG